MLQDCGYASIQLQPQKDSRKSRFQVSNEGGPAVKSHYTGILRDTALLPHGFAADNLLSFGILKAQQEIVKRPIVADNSASIVATEPRCG